MEVCSLDLGEVSRDTTCHGTMHQNGPQPLRDAPEAVSSFSTFYQGLPICQSLSYVSGLLGLLSCCFYLVGNDVCTLISLCPCEEQQSAYDINHIACQVSRRAKKDS